MFMLPVKIYYPILIFLKKNYNYVYTGMCMKYRRLLEEKQKNEKKL